MQALWKFLNSPYPIDSNDRLTWYRAVWISTFVAIFLMVFQPFGLSSIEGPYRLILIASFGLPCIPVILLQGLLFSFLAECCNAERYWKAYHQILAILVIPVLIGISNYFHGKWLFHWDFHWLALLSMVLYTLAVALFPVVAIVYFSGQRMNREHGKIALAMSAGGVDEESVESKQELSSNKQIVLMGENQQERLEITKEQFLFAKAEANYVEVVFVDEGRKTQRSLLRGSLKKVESQLSESADDILRCHRSYIVNRCKVEKAVGNAAGLELTLYENEHVPVSRSYVSLFR